jgi:hypothetical protein
MNGASSPRKFVRTAASTFFSAEEVARARAYHRPLYWAGAADVALQAGMLAALAWSAAGAALDPGSLPWWRRTPAYTAIVIAASAVVRTPLALWSGFIPTGARRFREPHVLDRPTTDFERPRTRDQVGEALRPRDREIECGLARVREPR